MPPSRFFQFKPFESYIKMNTQGVKVLKKKLLESLKNSVYKIVFKTFICAFSNESTGYIILKKLI